MRKFARLAGTRWSQSQLAAASGVSRSRIAGIESGRFGEVGFGLLRRILIALDLDLRITEYNSARPTLEQLTEEIARERKRLMAEHEKGAR